MYKIQKEKYTFELMQIVLYVFWTLDDSCLFRNEPSCWWSLYLSVIQCFVSHQYFKEGVTYEPAEQVYREYISVDDFRRFDYENVWHNQSHDAHPPRYYAAVHTICSFFWQLFYFVRRGSQCYFCIAYAVPYLKMTCLLTDNKMVKTLLAISLLCQLESSLLSLQLFGKGLGCILLEIGLGFLRMYLSLRKQRKRITGRLIWTNEYRNPPSYDLSTGGKVLVADHSLCSLLCSCVQNRSR